MIVVLDPNYQNMQFLYLIMLRSERMLCVKYIIITF